MSKDGFIIPEEERSKILNRNEGEFVEGDQNPNRLLIYAIQIEDRLREVSADVTAQADTVLMSSKASHSAFNIAVIGFVFLLVTVFAMVLSEVSNYHKTVLDTRDQIGDLKLQIMELKK